jgi:hypothetical protein
MQGLSAGARRTARVHAAGQVDEDRLARRHVARGLVAGALQRHRFAGHHDLVRTPSPAVAFAQAQRADAEGIAKGQQPMPAISAITAYEPLMRLCTAPTARKTSLGRQRQVARRQLQLVRQHVDQHLGVALGVDVAAVDVEQLGLQRLRIGQVAVVHQHDAEGRVDVEGLRLFFAVGVAGRRVAHLAQAHACRAAPACCACGRRRAPCRAPCA